MSLHPLPQTTSTAVGQAQFILLRVHRRAVGESPRFETEAPFHALMWLVGLARATSGPHGQGKLVAHRHVARLIDRERVCARAGILGQMLAFIIFITNFPPHSPPPSLRTGTKTRKSFIVIGFLFIYCLQTYVCVRLCASLLPNLLTFIVSVSVEKEKRQEYLWCCVRMHARACAFDLFVF